MGEMQDETSKGPSFFVETNFWPPTKTAKAFFLAGSADFSCFCGIKPDFALSGGLFSNRPSFVINEIADITRAQG